MTDDPREVLKVAGVECAEMDEWTGHVATLHGDSVTMTTRPHADAAILALARLAADGARYKWQRDECADELGRKLAVDYKYDPATVFAAADVIVDLERRWEEHQAK